MTYDDLITRTIEHATAGATPVYVRIGWTIRYDYPDAPSETRRLRAARGHDHTWTLYDLSESGAVNSSQRIDRAVIDRIRKTPGTYDASGGPMIRAWLEEFYQGSALIFAADKSDEPVTVTDEMLADLARIAEFDHVFTVAEDGTVSDGPDYLYAPTVTHSDEHDIEYEQYVGRTWAPLTGYTGQWGYSGAVMHASETLSGGLARDILTEPGTYVTVVVESDDPDGEEAAGWAVLRYTGMT